MKFNKARMVTNLQRVDGGRASDQTHEYPDLRRETHVDLEECLFSRLVDVGSSRKLEEALASSS
jgi:hypothetical protein